MRRSALRLYAPFLALLLGQAAFVVIAPSKGEAPNNQFNDAAGGGFTNTGDLGTGATDGGAVTADPGGTVTDPSTGGAASGGTAASSGGGATSGRSTGGATTGAAGGPAAGGGGTTATATGDRSHC